MTSGVLVAISIPIFTGQLKKARLATNQANARAAYACATTEFMLKYSESGSDKAVSFTYKNEDGTGAFDTTAASADITETNISKWETTTKFVGTGDTTLGDKTATEWTVVLDKDGKVTGYKGKI